MGGNADFKILGKLGAGAFGNVFKVRRVSDGQIYAMKQIEIASLSKKESETTMNEVRFLASARHPNVVCFFDSFIDPTGAYLNLVVEWCEAGDMAMVIKRTEEEKKSAARRYNNNNNKSAAAGLPESQVWDYLIQLLQGLTYLHSLGIVHRDIKPANLFLSSSGVVKIGDFNVSNVSKNGGLLKTSVGTPYYTSPEQWRNMPYDARADVWAVGCVVYELCTLRPPFDGRSLEDLGRNVCAGRFTPLPASYSRGLRDVISRLLSVRVDQRPTAADLLANPTVERHMGDVAEAARDAGPPEGAEAATLLKTLKMPKRGNIAPAGRFGAHRWQAPAPVAQPELPGPFFSPRADRSNGSGKSNSGGGGGGGGGKSYKSRGRSEESVASLPNSPQANQAAASPATSAATIDDSLDFEDAAPRGRFSWEGGRGAGGKQQKQQNNQNQQRIIRVGRRAPNAKADQQQQQQNGAARERLVPVAKKTVRPSDFAPGRGAQRHGVAANRNNNNNNNGGGGGGGGGFYDQPRYRDIGHGAAGKRNAAPAAPAQDRYVPSALEAGHRRPAQPRAIAAPAIAKAPGGRPLWWG